MNEVLAEEITLDAKSLPEVRLPAQEMFYWSGEVDAPEDGLEGRPR